MIHPNVKAGFQPQKRTFHPHFTGYTSQVTTYHQKTTRYSLAVEFAYEKHNLRLPLRNISIHVLPKPSALSDLTLPLSASLNRVGIIHSGYPEIRNISSLPFNRYEVAKEFDVFKLLDYGYFKTRNLTYAPFHNLHWRNGKADLYHFFNAISMSKKPWVTTFETSLPRLRSHGSLINRFGVRLLARHQCRRLIAMSENAKSIQLQILKEFYPRYYDRVASKMTVVSPPQTPLIDDYCQKPLPEKVHFLLVGADFFRKGGLECLRVMDELLRENYDLHFTIVSSLQYGDYASRATETDYRKALSIIAKHPQHITLHKFLPNIEVLKLFKSSHVALLPSYADTYGYSVLEAQAAGCPVVTTDIRALPEINNKKWGYVIPVSKNRLGNAQLGSVQKRATFSAHLQSSLKSIIRSILDQPESIRSKGEACLNRIKTQHCPTKIASQLEGIYDLALQ